MYAQDTASVLNTSVTVGHGDASLEDHVLSITGCPSMDVRDIESINVQAGVAEVVAGNASNITITPIAFTLTTHVISFYIEQFVSTLSKTPKRFLINVTSGNGADTVLQLCDAIRAQLNSHRDSGLKITAPGGTTTVTFKASTGSPQIRISVVSIGAGLTITDGSTALTTAGSANLYGTAGVNTTALLTAEFPSLTFVTSKKYSRYTFVYRRNSTNAVAGNAEKALCRHTLLVQDDATNFTGTAAASYTSAAGATSNGNTITVGSTTNLTKGMVLAVTAGTGAVGANTVVTEVISSTVFSCYPSPSTAFSGGATVVTGSLPNLQNFLTSIKGGYIDGSISFPNPEISAV